MYLPDLINGDFVFTFSDWDLTSLSLSGETCQKAGHFKVDDQRPLVSQSVTKNQSAPTELGQKTVTDKEKMKNAAVFLVGNSMSHHHVPVPAARKQREAKKVIKVNQVILGK